MEERTPSLSSESGSLIGRRPRIFSICQSRRISDGGDGGGKGGSTHPKEQTSEEEGAATFLSARYTEQHPTERLVPPWLPSWPTTPPSNTPPMMPSLHTRPAQHIHQTAPTRGLERWGTQDLAKVRETGDRGRRGG